MILKQLAQNQLAQNQPILKFPNQLLNLSFITFLPLLMLFALETTFRGSVLSTFSWIYHYPKQFLLSYVLIFSLTNIFYILQRKIYLIIGVLFLCFFSIIGFISRQKLIFRGEPLLPSDLILRDEALNIFKEFNNLIPVAPFLGITILTIIILVSLKFIPKENFNWPKKLAAFMLSLTVLLSFCTGVISLDKTFSIQLINWSQKMNSEENGVLLGFILNTAGLSVNEPADYDQTVIKEILDDTKPNYAVRPNFKPNIIFVMSEAFWDPTLLTEVSFSKDPIPYFRSLQKEHTSGTMLVPVYGGATANTEFEVLTGLSTQFLPRGIIPYVEYIHKPIAALPTVLKKQGYETTAIHTYDNWFYRRNHVYKNFGFNKFISKEFFNQPEYSGQYIRDTELTKRILEEINKTTDKPDFVYAISMQAHGPYSSVENPNNEIKISGNLNLESKAILENYTQIISDVDQSLKLLIEGLEQLDEPSIVVFFGDHLPMLGTDFNVYKEANYVQDEFCYQDYLKLYSVPLVIWDNFSSKKENLHLSSNFLGSYILKLAQKSGSPANDYLYTLAQNGTSIMSNDEYILSQDFSQQEINHYQLLQYDLMFGNEYAYLENPDYKPQANPDYVLGDGRLLILSATPPDTSVIEIQGENFLQDHKVYINGQPVQKDYKDPTYMIASLPKGLKSRSGTLDIQVKLTDSMGNVISESNTFQIKLS